MNDNVEIPKVQGGLGGGGGVSEGRGGAKGKVTKKPDVPRWCCPPSPPQKKKSLKNLTKAYLEIYICDLLGDTDFTVAESRP